MSQFCVILKNMSVRHSFMSCTWSASCNTMPHMSYYASHHPLHHMLLTASYLSHVMHSFTLTVLHHHTGAITGQTLLHISHATWHVKFQLTYNIHRAYTLLHISRLLHMPLLHMLYGNVNLTKVQPDIHSIDSYHFPCLYIQKINVQH